jgi:predicted short-subunit dehydrogenase-like oxidoreductase (DUF2520 family)
MDGPGVTAPQSGRAARLAVGVIGPGRAGSVLAAALARAGHPVVGVHAVSQRSRDRARELLGPVPFLEVEEVFARSQLVLLTVPDDALAPLVHSVADEGWIRPGQFVVHSSGRYGVAVLRPVTAKGALPLALHPVMTLTGSSMDLDRLTGCPFGVTAPPELINVAHALVIEMGGEPMTVAEDERELYHAALAHSANHLVSLVADAMDLLAKAGVATPGRMLAPLLGAALDNALRYGDRALTGPVARGDAGTVAAHLHELERVSPHTAAAYRAMARRTADRAIGAELLDAAAAEDLLAVLAERWTG